ncbi:hypothetical protein pipiens_005979 [Culex pipiens pipiens]|uniref:FLYWCH-type domain-containing protein n=1 Tax=Culex pipiens pipiens TaxID=38569 RepID=A0ABD1DWN8_CULPP
MSPPLKVSTKDLSPQQLDQVSLGPSTSDAPSVLHPKPIDTLLSQDTIKFIRSQKKSAQLVYRGYLYNRKLTQLNGNTTWRCVDVSKLRCKAICVTKFNRLVRAKRLHNHGHHRSRMRNKPLYDYPEDLEEYMDIYSRDPIAASQQLDVIDDGTDYKLVVRDTVEEVIE